MNCRAASKNIILIDLILLSFGCVLLICLVALVSFRTFVLNGRMTIEMSTVWILVIITLYIWYNLVVTDNGMIDITVKDQNSRHAIKVCQTWLTLSWFSICFGILIFALVSLQKMYHPKSTIEELFRWAVLINVFVFVMLRLIGVYFVSIFKQELKISIPYNITQSYVSLDPTNDNFSLSVNDIPPMYKDVVHLNIHELPPAYSAVILPNSNWI